MEEQTDKAAKRTRGAGETGSQSREEEILSLLKNDPELTVAALGRMTGVSAVTVRKVLDRLEAKGTILRSHGKAAALSHPDIVARQTSSTEQKNRIARAAAALVHDGDTVMMNSSTTGVLIAKYLFGKRGIRIVTNSTLILPFARMNPLLQVTLVGAEFRPATEALVGPLAIEMLQQYHAKFAFIGTAGFSARIGVTAHVAEEAAVVRKLTERADTTILVADSSKYGKAGFVCFLPITGVHKVVTDDGLPAEARRELADVGVEVITV
jgi:DeoR/GlpR family transcriptional regulator of sugar metabolism